MKKLIPLILLTALVGCATLIIDEDVVNSWKNIPVEELDAHSFFITIPLIKTKTDSGMEIRNYRNVRDFSSCSASATGYVSYSAFSQCSSFQSGCNNIFYIKDGIVKDYRLVGNCYTMESLRPENRFLLD